ncbi:MAG: hypothetical protein M3Y56_01310 [Armatimonadota bacterium]|nr:hypothetical protein [Armatimonadota bacterium]
MKDTPEVVKNLPLSLPTDRNAIDVEFANMATDTAYQEEALAICEEFAVSDWEAFQGGWRGWRSGEVEGSVEKPTIC